MHFDTIHKDNYSFVAEIYREGIATGVATFEKKVPDWESWNQSHLDFGRISCFDSEHMLGWAALSPVSSRCVYGGVAELSVYVSKRARGRGIGKKLVDKVVEESEQNGIWTIQSSIFPQNKASYALHLKCGFREIGYKEKVGQLDGRWYDNILFEKRSKII